MFMCVCACVEYCHWNYTTLNNACMLCAHTHTHTDTQTHTNTHTQRQQQHTTEHRVHM